MIAILIVIIVPMNVKKQFSLAKGVIKNTHLKTFVLISFSIIVILNLVVATKT